MKGCNIWIIPITNNYLLLKADTDKAAESSLAPYYQVHLLAINVTNLPIFIFYKFPNIRQVIYRASIYCGSLV